MKKFLLVMLMVAGVAGCAPLAPDGCKKTRALDPCIYKNSGRVSDKDIYGKQAAGIKTALDAALADPHAWNGKTCTVHLDFEKDGRLVNFIIKDGDQAYCQALKEAAGRATFPPFTHDRVYNDMGSARWDMQGQP
ncbi:cell envelope integrity TolA C-terminal domain-containing protein [Cronobacter sp. JZ38]|uniref:cell envelope integrity TolA C-terminal domain-containing protein n=1 Tax=Cronobacter sp. JZ38 TaxID=1906275 RepID=UPI00129F7659|nr:cell envelope integrity TolA C-terminal domain-containing protein [Cronobacter sp. JZ38]